MRFLFDTNILSELARPRPHSSVLSFASSLSQITLSVITVEEIFYGLAAKPNLRIQGWFEMFVETNCLVLPVTEAIAKQSGELRGKLTSTGKATHPSRYANCCNSKNSSTNSCHSKCQRFSRLQYTHS